MAGYDRTAALPVWRLRFEFDDHPDLLVRVTVPTVEAEVLAPTLGPLFLSGRRHDMATAVAALAGPFADSLLSWDLEWNGEPVKPTRRGLLRIDLELAADILAQWTGCEAWPGTRERAAAAARAQEAAELVEVERQLADLPMLALVPDDEAEVEVVEPVEPDEAVS